jgi:photosystem I subunit X
LQHRFILLLSNRNKFIISSGKKSKFTKFRRKIHMTYLTLLAATAPHTVSWSPKVAFVMIACNIVAIAIGKFTIKYKNAGPQLPSPALFGGMGLPALLGTTSFGHLLGAGMILGLANAGAL